MLLDCFLTAYDPSDLPGSSIDPLGFERGYLYLAERILPGLTNVAAYPRYFGVLCAGAFLADTPKGATPRAVYTAREQGVLTLERLWGLACSLASGVDPSLPPEPIRGIRYVRAAQRQLEEQGTIETTSQFKLLSRQAPYGVIGIYGAVAERLGFLSDRRMLELTPALGDRLAEAFVRETDIPTQVRTAVRQGDRIKVPLDELTAWGLRAHVSGECGDEEAWLLGTAYADDATRVRFGALLDEHRADPGEPELDRLGRMRDTLQDRGGDVDLHDLLDVILAYEDVYRLARFALDRVLWRCAGPGGLPTREVASDDGVTLARERLPRAAAQLDRVVATAHASAAALDVTRLDDVHRLALELGSARGDATQFVEGLLARHAAVQHGKLDRGRPKAPWIDAREGALRLTLGQVPGIEREPETPEGVPPHIYRTFAADAFPRIVGATVWT